MYFYPPSFKHRACCSDHADIWINAFATAFPRLAAKAADIHAQLNGYKDADELTHGLTNSPFEQFFEDDSDTEFMPFDADLISGDTAYLVKHYRITSHAADLFLSMYPVGIDGFTVAPATFNEGIAYLPSDVEHCPHARSVRANQKRREEGDSIIDEFLHPAIVEALMKSWGLTYKALYDLASLENFFMQIGSVQDAELGDVPVLVSPRMIMPDQWIADANITFHMDEDGYCEDGATRLLINPRPLQYKTDRGDRFTCPGFFQTGINLWPMLIPKKAMPLHEVLLESRFFHQAEPDLFADEGSVRFDLMRRLIANLAGTEDPMVTDSHYIELANGWLAPKEY